MKKSTTKNTVHGSDRNNNDKLSHSLRLAHRQHHTGLRWHGAHRSLVRRAAAFWETLRSEHAVVETQSIASLPPVLNDTIRWLDTYFSGGIPDFTPPIMLRGSEFRQAVWRALQNIPYGQTMTYSDIAWQLAAEQGIPKVSARAVGGAVGRNPISLIVPCHRVIGADGSLTGYAGGIERKAWLLGMEGQKHESRAPIN